MNVSQMGERQFLEEVRVGSRACQTKFSPPALGRPQLVQIQENRPELNPVPGRQVERLFDRLQAAERCAYVEHHGNRGLWVPVSLISFTIARPTRRRRQRAEPWIRSDGRIRNTEPHCSATSPSVKSQRERDDAISGESRKCVCHFAGERIQATS